MNGWTELLYHTRVAFALQKKSMNNDILMLCINVIMKSLPNENHSFSHWLIVQHINDDFNPNLKIPRPTGFVYFTRCRHSPQTNTSWTFFLLIFDGGKVPPNGEKGL